MSTPLRHISTYLIKLKSELNQHEIIAQSIREQIVALESIHSKVDNKISVITVAEKLNGDNKVMSIRSKEHSNSRTTLKHLISFALQELGGEATVNQLLEEVEKVRPGTHYNSIDLTLRNNIKTGLFKKIKGKVKGRVVSNGRGGSIPNNLWTFNEVNVKSTPVAKHIRPNQGLGQALIDLFNKNLGVLYSSYVLHKLLSEKFPDVAESTVASMLTKLSANNVPGFSKKKIGNYFSYVAHSQIRKQISWS